MLSCLALALRRCLSVVAAVRARERLKAKASHRLSLAILQLLCITASSVLLVQGFLPHHSREQSRRRAEDAAASGSSLTDCALPDVGLSLLYGTSPVTLQSAPSSPPIRFSWPACPQPHRVHSIADPFLLIPASSSSSSSKSSLASHASSSSRPWYLFFTQRPVSSHARTEVAVAESRDLGLSWSHVGPVLADGEQQLSVSHPFVVYDAQRDGYILIPDNQQQREVRVYSASSAALPAGWTYRRSALQGYAFARTTAVQLQADSRWFIFTTVGDSLRLFHCDDLLLGQWTEHPSSPLSHGEQSAGKPVVFDGVVHRFTREAAGGIRVLRLHGLSRTEFAQSSASILLPQPDSRSRARHSRLLHLDAIPVLSAMPDELRFNASAASLQPLSAAGSSYLSRFQRSTLSMDRTPLWLAVLASSEHSGHTASGSWRAAAGSVAYSQALLPVVLAAVLLLWLLLSQCRRPALRAEQELRKGAGSLWSRLFHGVQQLLQMEQSPRVRSESRENLLQLLPDECEAPVPADDDGQRPLPIVLIADNRLSLSALSLRILYAALQLILLFFFLIALIMVLPTLAPLPWTVSSPSASSTAADVVPASQSSSSASMAVSVAVDGSVYVVTAASSAYYDRLCNFVGSVHTFSPSVPIAVYDLGLTLQQRVEAAAWHNVTVLPFPFTAYPLHVRNLFSYAWKILIFDRAFTDLPRAEAVVVLDSGLELRSRSALPRIVSALQRQGYWFASQPNSVDALSHPQTLQAMSISWSAIAGQSFCAGGLTGWSRDSAAYRQMLPRAVLCALDEDCILPASAGQDNHRHDQVVMSALVYATGRRCEPEREWREWDMTRLTEREDEDGDSRGGARSSSGSGSMPATWIAARRWHQPKPYMRALRLEQAPHSSMTLQSPADAAAPNDCLATLQHQSSSRALRRRLHGFGVGGDSSFPRDSGGDEVQPELDLTQLQDGDERARRCVASLVLSTLDSSKLQHDDPLRLCLRRQHNSRWECRAEIQRHRLMLSADAAEAQHFATLVARRKQADREAASLQTSLESLSASVRLLGSLLQAQAETGRAAWLIGDLYGVPIVRRLRQWRLQAVVAVLYVVCIALWLGCKQWRKRGSGQDGKQVQQYAHQQYA